MAGIVAGHGGPDGLQGVAPEASLLPIQVLELQHGALMGTTATLLAGLDRALDPNGDGNLADHAEGDPRAARRAVRGLRRVGRDGRRAGRRARRRSARRRGRATTARPAARFGTVASPAASPELARGRRDGRPLEPARRQRHAQRPRPRASSAAGGADPATSETTIDAAPLVGALKPTSAGALPLVLPAGPTLSDAARAPADVVDGHERGRLPRRRRREPRRGKAVLLPRDGALIAQRAVAASAAGAKALVLYGDGGAPPGALGLDDRVTLPIVVIPGDQGAAVAGTLLTGGSVSVTFAGPQDQANPDERHDRAVLVHGPRLRRLRQARPRRARRRDHDVGARARVRRAERHLGRRSAGRGRRRARAAGAPDVEPGRSCAARSSAPGARSAAARATAPPPSRPRAAAPSASATPRPRPSSPSPRRSRSASRAPAGSPSSAC